jgi:hypothetical protein
MITGKRWFALCYIACLLILSPTLKAQQSAGGDNKALMALLENRYATFWVARQVFDVQTLRKVALPDMREGVNGAHKTIEEISAALANPKFKDDIASRRALAALHPPPTCTVTSFSIHGDDASGTVITVQRVNMQSPVVMTSKCHVDWKKIGNDWMVTRMSDLVVVPQWAVAFQKAVGLIGKSKAQLVETFGAPIRADDMRYHYVIDSQRRSATVFHRDLGQTLTVTGVQTTDLDFALEGDHVADVILNFNTVDPEAAVFYPLGQVWTILDTVSPKPTTLQTNVFEVMHYWLHQAHDFLAGPIRSDFGSDFNGSLKGGIPIVIAGHSKVPPLKGTPIFDVQNNDYEIKTYAFNPAFDWRTAQVYTIRTQTHKTGLPEGQGYPVLEKP